MSAGMPEDPIAKYVDVLHHYGVRSEQAQAFKKLHAADAEFRRRAKGAERLFRHRDEVIRKLGRLAIYAHTKFA